MTFSEFVEYKKNKELNESLFNEAFKNNDSEKAVKKIITFLKKKIPGLVGWTTPFNTKVGGKECMTYYCFQKKGYVFGLNFKNDDSSTEVYSIDFFKNIFDILNSGDKPVKTLLSIYTMGTSVAYFLPIIVHVMNEHDFKLSSDKLNSLYQSSFNKKNECRDFWLGNACYHIYENCDIDFIDNIYNNSINEKADDELKRLKSQKFSELRQGWNNIKGKPHNDPERSKVKQLENEYEDIKQAIAGGVETIDELKAALKVGVSVYIENKIKEAEEEEKINSLKDPEQTFKEMNNYVKMVVRGTQPGLIICGTPGVGKTYRVHEILEKLGKEEFKNLFIFKAKVTTRALYCRLYEYKNPGDIVVIDDADGVVGPHAPEDAVNVLKAALDSGKKRTICYEISGKVINSDGVEIPKRFDYNGGIIVMTNHSPGELDTAFRGRTFIQDIDFNTGQILNLIKGIINSDNNGSDGISHLAKHKAYEYLESLSEKNPKIIISIRTFMTCAKIYQLSIEDDDVTEEDAKSMIKDQMRNQAARGGKKY